MNTQITSRKNPLYKELKKISIEKNDYIFIEGKKLFTEAIKSNVTIEKIIISKENSHFLNELDLKNTEIILMANSLIASIYSTETKPEQEDLIICLAKIKKWELIDIFSKNKIVIFLEKIQDPGNLGTIARSALAFNAGGIILSKDSTSPYNTKAIRASAGAIFSLPIVFLNTSNELKQASLKFSYKLVAAVKDSNNILKKASIKNNCIFLFGNEGSGLSKEILNLADELITIPQSDKVESLNLATSASIVLWNNYG